MADGVGARVSERHPIASPAVPQVSGSGVHCSRATSTVFMFSSFVYLDWSVSVSDTISVVLSMIRRSCLSEFLTLVLFSNRTLVLVGHAIFPSLYRS